MKSNRSLVSDSISLQSICDFFASEKPPSINSVDVSQIVYLISHKAEEKEIFDSQQTIAKALGCDLKTVVRSQKRLQKLGWIARPQRKGRTCALSLQFQNVPSERAVRALITQDAKTLALHYMTVLKGKGLRKKFPKHWLGRQHLSAQRILDKCNGNLELAMQIVIFAVTNPRLQNKAKKSLYELVGQWPKVTATFDAAHPEQTAEPSPIAPSKPITAYTIRKTTHPGVGLRWNAKASRVEQFSDGQAIPDAEVHRRIIPAGLKRHLVSKEFIRSDTHEPVSLNELQERLMGSKVWAEVQAAQSMEEAQ